MVNVNLLDYQHRGGCWMILDDIGNIVCGAAVMFGPFVNGLGVGFIGLCPKRVNNRHRDQHE